MISKVGRMVIMESLACNIHAHVYLSMSITSMLLDMLLVHLKVFIDFLLQIKECCFCAMKCSNWGYFHQVP